MNKENLDIIRLEYENGDYTKAVDSIEEATYYICSSLNTLTDDRREIIKGIKEDFRNKRITHIKNYFSYLTGKQYDEEVFTKDIDLSTQQIDLTGDFLDYNRELLLTINESNAMEIYKLAIFTNRKYMSNYEHLEEMRKNNIYGDQDFSFQGKDTINDQEEFKEFFGKKQGALSAKKIIVKA